MAIRRRVLEWPVVKRGALTVMSFARLKISAGCLKVPDVELP